MQGGETVSIYFATRDEFVQVPLREVVFFEAQDNYCNITFRNGLCICVNVSLTAIEKQVNDRLIKAGHRGEPMFIRIGRKFMVNVRFIVHIDVLKQTLLLSDCRSAKVHELNVAKEALRNLKNLYIPKHTL